MYDLAVIIARMQPMHMEHENLIRKALSKAHKVLLLLGSDGSAPSLRNPFSVSQRATMVDLRFSKEIGQERLIIEGLRDMSYQGDLWIEEVKRKVRAHEAKTILMVRGGREDSDNIKSDFPIHDHEVHPITQPISGTALREAIFEGYVVEQNKIDHKVMVYARKNMPVDLFKEHEAAKAYRESWAGSPFPPIFLAADNVVAWYRTSSLKPRILLIERKSEFGNGKWALPGGYVEANQTLEQAARDELEQETGLVIDKPFGQPTMIDAINRSARGRMITAVFHNEIHQDTAPEVVGGDDAAKAFWVPLMELRLHERRMFSDHYHIIGKLYPEIYHV